MASVLDDICEPGPVLTPDTVKPLNISKATALQEIRADSTHV